jgi:glyoxylase-like metal-dependent hydrolase (beta-lactamase superfamily II)
MRATILLFLLCLAVPTVLAEEEPDPFASIEIETIPLGDDLAMLVGAGGNLVVAWDADGAFLVDDQYAPLTERILEAVRALTAQPVRFVLNTHWHFDHTGGNENLAGEGVLLFSHDNVRRRLSSDQFIEFLDRHVEASPPAALPVVTFNDSLTFHLGMGEVRIFHMPHAHTDGDALVHFADRDVVHSGDTIFFGLYPFIDVSSGGSIDGMIAAIEKVLDVCGPDTKIVPGHGPLLTTEQVEEYLAMLTGIRRAVLAAVAAGAEDLAAVQAARPAAPWDEAWGQTWITSDQFVELVYTTLPEAALE